MAEELVDSDEQVKAAVNYTTMLGKPMLPKSWQIPCPLSARSWIWIRSC